MNTVQTPAPVQPPRHARKHSVRFWALIGLAGFAALITLSGIVSALSPARVVPQASTSTSAPARVTPKASTVPVAPTATHAATLAPKTAHATAQAPVTQGPTEQQRVSAWAAGPGYGSFKAVQADITAVQLDVAGQNLPAVETDGATLAADAQNAMVSPPPVGSGEYQTAMKFYEIAGNDMAAGDIADASASLQLGTAALNVVTADMKSLLPAAS